MAARGAGAAARDAGDRVPHTARRRRSTRTLGARVSQGLSEAGYVEGRNVAIEYRWADGQIRSTACTAAELVAPKRGRDRSPTAPLRRCAAKAATTTIPIVFSDRRRPGQAASSRASRGRAATLPGRLSYESRLAAKRLELLHEMVPRLTRMAARQSRPIRQPSARCCEHAGSGVARSGCRLMSRTPATERDIERAFAASPDERVARSCRSEPLSSSASANSSSRWRLATRAAIYRCASSPRPAA